MRHSSNSSHRSPHQRPPAVVHVDLDGAADIYKMHGWSFSEPIDPIFESGLRNCLDFFEQNEIRATLFVIANSLENPRKRALIEEAAWRGHEIASHTSTHPDLYAISRTEKAREIFESRARIESELAVPVRGFRAPGYRIDRETCELLAEAGYEYDSSAFPTAAVAARLQCSPEMLKSLHRPLPDKQLLELPLPDHSPWPVPFNPSYSLVIGNWYFRSGIRKSRQSDSPLVILFHLIDFVDPMPAAYLNGWKSRIFTLSTMSANKKRRRCQAMLDFARRYRRLTTTLALLSDFRAAKGLEAENIRAIAPLPA